MCWRGVQGKNRRQTKASVFSLQFSVFEGTAPMNGKEGKPQEFLPSRTLNTL